MLLLLHKKISKALFIKGGLFFVLIIIFSYSNNIFCENNRPATVLGKMFSSISNNLFTKEYEKKKTLSVNGSLSVNAPVSSLSKKLRKVNESVSFSVDFDGVFLPNSEKKLDLSGDLGDIVINSRNNKNILYSEDFQAYSLNNAGTKSHLENFRSFFISKINQIKNDILFSGRWSLSFTNNVVYGSVDCYKVTAKTYIKEEQKRLAKSKSQNFNDLITFWKRGTVVFFIRKKDNLPMKIEYENPIENIKSELVFAYNQQNKPVTINVSGDSANVFGSGELQLSYDEKGILQNASLDFSNQLSQTISLNLTLNFLNNLNTDSVKFIPPFGSQKMGKENLKLLILTNVAGTLLRMQQAGIKIKTLKF